MEKIKKYFGILILLFLLGCGSKEEIPKDTQITELTTNYEVNPLGIDGTPVFGWKMVSTKSNQKQSSYQILVSNTIENLERGNYIWDSGRREDNKSVSIKYEGKELLSEEKYFWKVLVWDKDGEKYSSSVSTFEMGKNGDVWKDTNWITNPIVGKKNTQGHDNFISEINYEFQMEETDTGFVWGAENGQYKEHYIWKIIATRGMIELEITRHSTEDSEEIIENVIVSQDIEKFIRESHQIKIIVKEEKADTYLDDNLISSEIDLECTEIKGVGLWVTRGEKNAWYDNIQVKNIEGTIVYEEDFQHKNTIFSPLYIKVEGGRGRADSGYIITPGGEEPAPMFRKNFETIPGKKIESARLYASSLGIYDIFMNGNDINPLYGAPGQSVYNKEIYYRTYDMTDYLQEGGNTIGFMLGHGRYDRANASWGEQLALYAQLVIKYEDGNIQRIGTDNSWSVSDHSPIRNDDLYSGEYYDANYEQANWSQYNFLEDKDLWKKAVTYDLEQESELLAAPDAGIKAIEVLTPISVKEPLKGTYVVDFGKNFNGICELEIQGKKGDIVVMRHGEYLNTESLENKDDEIGTVWTRNLCNADNTDYYVFKEDGSIVYSPRFSYRGFRYLQITGLTQEPEIKNIRGIVITTDNKRNGYFECSDENINLLYNTIYTSQLSNYVDIPTDCPQRDERLGWTGDAQVFAYTGALNSNIANFMEKYVDFLRISQLENGSYQQIVPFEDAIGGSNGWSDAGIIIVWELFQQYGNLELIEENLPAMMKYIDYLVSTSENFLRKEKGYNDHNALSYLDDTCCNTAQCAYVSGLLAKMCEFIGEKDLAQKYKDIQEKYVVVWRQNFLRDDGAIGNWTQSEYALALGYGLYPENLGKLGAEKLNFSIEQSNYHISTGYITSPLILTQLCKYGYIETAYKMIQKKEYPSWNYMVEKTSSLTESWFTIKENEEGNTKITGSLNHVALGAVGQWFYTDILGIKRDEKTPAYQHFYLEPCIGGGLSYAKGSYDSVYGKIESSWEIEEEKIKFQFVIPANTTATLTLPGEEYRGVELGSGEYEFVLPILNTPYGN